MYYSGDRLLYAISKIENEERFREVLEVVAKRGTHFRPNDFVWDILRVCLKVDTPVITMEENREVSPVLVASFIRHGQILPIWVDQAGNILDGRTRRRFFGSETKYLVYPQEIPSRKVKEIHLRTSLPDDVIKEIAKRLGVHIWLS